MKTAIYIEDGTIQLVITPESEFEKGSLSTFKNKALDAEIFAGTFYDCRGGWIRQTAHKERVFSHASTKENDSSIIIRINEEQPSAIEQIQEG